MTSKRVLQCGRIPALTKRNRGHLVNVRTISPPKFGIYRRTLQMSHINSSRQNVSGNYGCLQLTSSLLVEAFARMVLYVAIRANNELPHLRDVRLQMGVYT